jgi:hypothetical protein
MSSGTEIYVCKPGQKLEQGRMEFVPETMDRARAEADARERFARDDHVAKVGYYAINDEGDSKPIYTAESPTIGDAGASQLKQGTSTGGKGKAAPKAKKAARRTLLSRLLDLVTDEVPTN